MMKKFEVDATFTVLARNGDEAVLLLDTLLDGLYRESYMYPFEILDGAAAEVEVTLDSGDGR